ncbi:hypothetical protein LINPERPRIM_LOCUS13451 [Linum perenne]
MTLPRTHPQYLAGVEKFLDFAFAHSRGGTVISCPCSKCKLNKSYDRDTVFHHLLRKLFLHNYTFWYIHGEAAEVGQSSFTPNTGNNLLATTKAMHDLVNDAFGVIRPESVIVNDPTINPDVDPETTTTNDFQQDATNPDHEDFLRLLKDGEEPLYDGCKNFTRLSFLTRLFHIKYMHKISDKAMEMILELLLEAFETARIPNTIYEANKTIKTLGLTYTKIHACQNDCMLY